MPRPVKRWLSRLPILLIASLPAVALAAGAWSLHQNLYREPEFKPFPTPSYATLVLPTGRNFQLSQPFVAREDRLFEVYFHLSSEYPALPHALQVALRDEHEQIVASGSVPVGFSGKAPYSLAFEPLPSSAGRPFSLEVSPPEGLTSGSLALEVGRPVPAGFTPLSGTGGEDPAILNFGTRYDRPTGYSALWERMSQYKPAMLKTPFNTGLIAMYVLMALLACGSLVRLLYMLEREATETSNQS